MAYVADGYWESRYTLELILTEEDTSPVVSATAILDRGISATISSGTSISVQSKPMLGDPIASELSVVASKDIGGNYPIMTPDTTDMSVTARMIYSGSISLVWNSSIPVASGVSFYAYPLTLNSTSTLLVSPSIERLSSASLSSESLLSASREPILISSSSSALSSSANVVLGASASITTASTILLNAEVDMYASASISSGSTLSAQKAPFLKISSSSTLSAIAYGIEDLTVGLAAHFLLNNTGHDYVNKSALPSVGNAIHNGYGMNTDAVASQPTEYNWGGKQVTYSIWASPNEIFQYYQFVLGTADNTYSASNYSFFLNYNNNVLSIVTSPLANAPVSAPDIQQHIVFYADHTNGDYSWYLDKVFMGSGNSSHLTSSDNGTVLAIGGFAAFSSTYSRGTNTTNLRIYESEKNASFVTALYDEGPNPRPLETPSFEGVRSYYPLNGNSLDVLGVDHGSDGTTTYVDDPNFGIVADFDGGDNSKINIYPNIVNPPYIGLSFWIDIDPGSSNNYPTIWGDSLDNALYLAPSQLTLYTFTDRVNWSMPFNFDGAGWKYIYFDVGYGEGRVFINGVHHLTLPYDNPAFNSIPDGSIGGARTWNIDGRMRSFRLYTEKPTDQAIEDVYAYESNFRDVLDIVPVSNLISTSTMSIVSTVAKKGKSKLYSHSIFEAKESLLAGISIYEANSFVVSATGGLVLNATSSVSTGAELNIKATMIAYIKASILSPTSIVITSTLIEPILEPGVWFLTNKTHSGYGVAVAIGVPTNFTPTQCKFFDNISDIDGTATLVHDPLSMEFTNRGYPNEINCEPHDGNDYIDAMFPNSREVSISVITKNNRPIIGSKIDSRVPFKYPLMYSVDAEYIGQIVTSVGAIDLNENLLAQYLLGDNSDDLTGSYDGTDTSMTYSGDAAQFNGTSSYISTAVMQPGTVSIWASLVEDGLVRRFLFHFGKSDENTFALHEGSDDSDTLVILIDNIGYGTGVSAMSNTGFHHYVLTADGNLYIDGVYVYSTGTQLTHIMNQAALIGADRDPGTINDFVKGEISNFRVYSDIKDQSFITALYDEGYNPKLLPLPTKDGLIAHFPFSSSGEDIAGNYDAAVQGSVTYVDDATYGSVAYLKDGYFLSNIPTPTSFSVLVWAKFEVLANYTDLFLSPNAWGAFVAHSGAGGEMWVGTDVDNRLNSGDIPAGSILTNQWYGFGFTYNDATHIGTFYMDGTSKASGGGMLTPTAWGGLKFGSLEDNNGRFRQGRVYNRALEAAEMLTIFNYEDNLNLGVSLTDIVTGLVAHYPLATNSLDISGSGYNGVDLNMTYTGEAAFFDADTSRSIKATPAYTAFGTGNASVSLWTYVDANSSGQMCSFSHQSSTSMLAFYADDTMIQISSRQDSFGATQYAQAPGTYGGWHNMLVTFAAGTAYVYVDGVFQASGPCSYLVNLDNFVIGGNFAASGGYTSQTILESPRHGNVKKVRVYNKTLTAEDVFSVYYTDGGVGEVVEGDITIVPDGVTPIEFLP